MHMIFSKLLLVFIGLVYELKLNAIDFCTLIIGEIMLTREESMDGTLIAADDVQRISLASLNGEFGAIKNFNTFILEDEL